jgi:hypothetical protein
VAGNKVLSINTTVIFPAGYYALPVSHHKERLSNPGNFRQLRNAPDIPPGVQWRQLRDDIYSFACKYEPVGVVMSTMQDLVGEGNLSTTFRDWR